MQTVFAKQHVFCVHGFLGSKWSMRKIERKLVEDGYSVVNWKYRSRLKTIEEHIEHLVEDLNEVAKKAPNEPIYFVTHSLGGIIVRGALNHPRCPREAKYKCIVIAPPNRGAFITNIVRKVPIFRRWSGPNTGKELMNVVKDGFDYLGEFPEDVKVFVIAGTKSFNPFLKEPNDGVVCTQETRLKTPHEYMEVKAGHTLITHHAKVIEKVRHFL